MKQLVPAPARARVRQLLWSAPGTREYLFRRAVPDGASGVDQVGHRRFVGTQWDEPGLRQFQFMLGRGLRPDSVLVDVGCGSLRGGIHFIPYLDEGHYLGIEKEPDLLHRGVEHELGDDTYARKKPELIASDRFEFHRFSKRPDLGISVSLFTHLSEDDVDLCLANLKNATAPGFTLYATFAVLESRLHRNPPRSHAHVPFRYRSDRIRRIARRHSFSATPCPDWRDPIANQAMFELRREPAAA